MGRKWVCHPQADRALAPQTEVQALLSTTALHGYGGRHAGWYGPVCEKSLNIFGERILIHMAVECQEKWYRIEGPGKISAVIQGRTEPGRSCWTTASLGYFWCLHAFKMCRGIHKRTL